MELILEGADRNRPVVLCSYSLQFNRDIDVLQQHSTRYAWAALPDTFLTEAQAAWMPARLRDQGYYVNESGADVDAAWAKAKRFGLGLLANLVRQGVKLTAVMAGNLDYWQDECLRLACREVGLPFLVLMREHNLTGIRLQTEGDYYAALSRIPKITAMACAGEATRELFERLNLLPAPQLRVTGWPRLDVWRHPVAPSHDRPIVLMSYLKGYGADTHFLGMMHLFSDLARQYPQVPFLLKAKHAQEETQLRQIVAQRGLSLEVIDTMYLPSLLSNARAVVGFHSAAMYEALLSPTRILIPRWGETDQAPKGLAPSPADPNLRGHMEFLPDEPSLRRAVAECVVNGPPPVDMAARARVFNRYFAFDPNRTAVQRVEDFVDEFGRPDLRPA